MRTVFELKVWHQDERSCFFLLLWDHRSKKMTASVPYSKDVQKCYQRWRQRYYRFYQLSSPQAPGNSGRLNLGSGDLAHDLTEAEKELVQAFQRWLGEGDVRNIQQRIRDQLATQSANEKPSQVDVFLACDSDQLTRLPWELWSLAISPPGALRIVRTAMDEPEGTRVSKTRCGKARILAVLGNDPNLPLQEDWKSVRSLRSIAHIEQFMWQPEDTVITIKQKFANAICDSRGWDVLFFAGHSDETAVTGGRMAITPNISLSISELEEYLTQARENGLQLAIFNSCSGLSIANSLVNLGLQVVVMREPIRNDVAQSFLTPLCQQLAKHQDIHSALLHASHHLQSAERFAYPSTHLIPSFFSPSGATPYGIKSFGWRGQLQQWRPTKREAISLGTVTLISLMVPVQGMLLDLRTATQASYREFTRQIPDEPPPVTLIAIDQISLNRADAAIEGFKVQPMDRQYLSNIIDQLANAKAKVVGIDYFLDAEEPKEELLANAIRRNVQEHNTWFIVAGRDRHQRWARDEIASSQWSLKGDAFFYDGKVMLPKERTCALPCPFAYGLALASTITQTLSLEDTPQPTLQNKTDFQNTLSLYLRQTDKPILQPFLDQTKSYLELPYITDFSIPPSHIYKRVPAWQFLSDSTAFEDLSNTIVIVASDRYAEASDKFSSPTAYVYWCRSTYPSGLDAQNCPDEITGGEYQAYMTHHLLKSHLIIAIPNWWLVCLWAFIGKGTGLYLLRSEEQRKPIIFKLLASMFGYGLFAMQMYISASVLIPIFLPLGIFALHVTPILRRKPYINRHGSP